MSNFVAGITVFCFAASYTVSFALEATRLWFKSGIRGAFMVGFAAAGLLAHTLFLVQRAVQAESVPLSSPFDWYLVAAWLLVVFYLWLTVYYQQTAVGIFVLPLVFALIAIAYYLADKVSFARETAAAVWGVVHGLFLLVGMVAVLIGCVTGVMYLIKSRRLKRAKTPKQGLQLPPLEWLERTGEWAIVISILCIGIGWASGIVLNMFKPHVSWSDPVVWTSGFMFLWVVVVGIFNAVYKPSRHGRKVAYLTLATFVFLLFHLGVSLLYPTEHGSKASETSASRAGTVIGQRLVKDRETSRQPRGFGAAAASRESRKVRSYLHGQPSDETHGSRLQPS